jgi:hypothetical protein
MAGVISRVSWPWCALGLGAFLLFAAPTHAQTLSDRLLADARDGRLDEFEFLAAALIASGVEDECELEGWMDSFTERSAELLNAVSDTPANQRLRIIHAALHAAVLNGQYEATATDLRLALSRGDFNCLSSLAVYLDLCHGSDLHVEIWLARGHVFLRAAANGEAAVIEPGTSQWESRWHARQPFGRQITPVELLGKFYYNRGVQALKDREFATGLDLLQISLVLDPTDSDARANLVAGLNNWAVEHFRAKRYGDAASLIEEGLLLAPSFAPLIANERLVRAKLGE